MSTGRDLYGGDPCPVCGVILDYDEFGSEREPGIVHPDPDCGWRPSGYPSTRRGWIHGRDPDGPEALADYREKHDPDLKGDER